jgi:hypothetical protein
MISSLRTRLRALMSARGIDDVREQPDFRAQAAGAAAASAAAYDAHVAARRDADADADAGRAPVPGAARR